MGKRGRLEDEEEDRLDLISRLPDAVLGDIVSLLSTRDGARTQVLSSRWRHIWRSAPLNLDLQDNPAGQCIPCGEISGILSLHRGPGRRFSIPIIYSESLNRGWSRALRRWVSTHTPRALPFDAAALDGWLRSPALDNLQELEFHHSVSLGWSPPPLPLPASVHRFSTTLRVASFGGCSFPDGNDAGALHLPLLRQLGLSNVKISESSLHALLAGCPVLQSLLLVANHGFPRARIVSPSLRSIGVCSGRRDNRLRQLIIEAPCLERLLFFGTRYDMQMDISVISAPRLELFGPLSDDFPRLEFGSTAFKGLRGVNLVMLMRSVKVLALKNMNLSLDAVVNFIKCFPFLEKLYIKSTGAGEKNTWCRKYRNLTGTLDIRLKKIVVTNYRGNKSHVNFAKFFVLNARVLESMRFNLEDGDPSNVWIERQRRLLQTKNRASRDAQFVFVSCDTSPLYLRGVWNEQVHDLSTADPFARSHDQA